MDRLAFTAMASINERRLLREQLNNELANVSTIGFKTSFERAMIAVCEVLLPISVTKPRTRSRSNWAVSDGVRLCATMIWD